MAARDRDGHPIAKFHDESFDFKVRLKLCAGRILGFVISESRMVVLS
jgi:hypothetical protein